MKKLLFFGVAFLIFAACSDDGDSAARLTVRVTTDPPAVVSPSRVAYTTRYATPTNLIMTFTGVGIATTLDGSWQTVDTGDLSVAIGPGGVTLADAATVPGGVCQGVKITYLIGWVMQGDNPTVFSCTNSDLDPSTTVYCVTAALRDVLTNAPHNVPVDRIHVLAGPVAINAGESKTASLVFDIQDKVMYEDWGVGDLRNFSPDELEDGMSMTVE